MNNYKLVYTDGTTEKVTAENRRKAQFKAQLHKPKKKIKRFLYLGV